MAHCPYCGTLVKEKEQFCVNCGKKLPEDLSSRSNREAGFHRWWLVPIGAVFIALIAIGFTYLTLEKRTAMATEQFNKGEKHALEGNYQKAKEAFSEAIDLKSNFTSAVQNKSFMNTAMNVDSQLAVALELLHQESYQESLKIITEVESTLKNYNGEIVNQLLDRIVTQRNNIKVEQLESKLANKPSIDDLKVLLWQAEAIQNDEARTIANDIRKRIVSFAFSTANESLKLKQYSEARAIVNDGLKYAPDSEKLRSLKTTIEKEEVAFEIEQQKRIEQAMIAAEEERERNKNDAVEVLSVTAEQDDYGDLVVKGKIKSVATVPIYSVSVSYELIDQDGNVVLDNEVFAYPDTLYPDEEGQFEFSHFDVSDSLNVKVAKVKWFLN